MIICEVSTFGVISHVRHKTWDEAALAAWSAVETETCHYYDSVDEVSGEKRDGDWLLSRADALLNPPGDATR